jgi:CheY-like chemotaxis protein
MELLEMKTREELLEDVQALSNELAAIRNDAPQSMTSDVQISLAYAAEMEVERRQRAEVERVSRVKDEFLVDDNADAMNLVKHLLEQCGVSVSGCGSAEECMQRLANFHPDVLISDIGMPDMDGYAMMRELRRLPREKGGATPVIALTAFARSEDRRRAMLAGFDMHVSKPVEPGELVAVVARMARRT